MNATEIANRIWDEFGLTAGTFEAARTIRRALACAALEGAHDSLKEIENAICSPCEDTVNVERNKINNVIQFEKETFHANKC